MFLRRGSGPAIARIPKNATQSIVRAMMDGRTHLDITNDEALESDIRVAFLRDPFDRLASGYSWFSNLQSKGGRTQPPVPTFDGYESYVDWALESDDSHVLPQHDLLLASHGEFVPNRLHWVHDIQSVWERYYTGLIPHEHKVTRLETSDYRASDIRERYAKDFELCRML